MKSHFMVETDKTEISFREEGSKFANDVVESSHEFQLERKKINQEFELLKSIE